MTKHLNVLILNVLILLTSCDQETPPIELDTCLIPLNNAFEETLDLIVTSEDNLSDTRECALPERSVEANIEINYVLRDFTPAQQEKMDEAIRRLKIVINSTEFKEAILKHTYKGERVFVDNNGLSNEEVYESLLLGQETLNPVIDEEIDIDITLYFEDNSTVGYTYPSSERIWVNNKFFATYSYGKVAANVIHEWTHKLGYGHDYQRTTRRSYSVPYGVGSIVKELVDSM